MLTIQKNDLFQIVKTAGLDPSTFRIEDAERTTSIHVATLPIVFEAMNSVESFDVLTYRYRTFAPSWPYAIAPRPKNYNRLSTGKKKVIDNDLEDGWFPVGEWCSFEEVSTAFALWVKEHVIPALTNAAAPDLWSDAAAGIPNFYDVPTESTDSFTTEDQRQLRDALQLFRERIRHTFAPDDEQFREITRRLDYLADALQRLNKFDWRALALSTVIGVGTTLSVDTQAGRQLWALFHQAMRSIGHLLGP